MTFPLVTIVVPTRDEADDIVACIEHVAAQDYPVNRFEVIVVDGCSADGTAGIAKRALSRFGFAGAHVLENPVGTTSSNLNLGLARASGELLCRVDARTRIQPHYVRTCVEVLSSRPEVSVVGGAQVAVARDSSARAIGIARALNNRWSMGGSRYRRSTQSGPSDTVYLGAFRTPELREVGGWDERLGTNQDFDLNRRMAGHGLVWFDARLRSGYLPRPTIAALAWQYVRFGRAKARYWAHAHEPPQVRQWPLILAPPAVVLAALTLVLRSHRPRTQVVRLGSAAVACAIVADWKGSAGPSAGPLARLAAIAAMAVVAVGWWTGVATGLVSLVRRRSE